MFVRVKYSSFLCKIVYYNIKKVLLGLFLQLPPPALMIPARTWQPDSLIIRGPPESP